MKTVLASIVALGFLSSAALACPHEDAQKQTEKKDTKGDSTKQAQAPKATPKAPATPAPAPAPAPKAPVKPAEAPKT